MPGVTRQPLRLTFEAREGVLGMTRRPLRLAFEAREGAGGDKMAPPSRI
jgi:hypothetical protein